jgi:psiF repeat
LITKEEEPMRPITLCAAILSLAMVTAVSAQTPTPPPGGGTTPAATDKQTISKECSRQADAQNLHGKARKKFRAECKRRGGKPA